MIDFTDKIPEQLIWPGLVLLILYVVYRRWRQSGYSNKRTETLASSKGKVMEKPKDLDGLKTRLLEKARDLKARSDQREEELRSKGRKVVKKSVIYAFAPVVIIAIILAFSSLTTALIILFVGTVTALPLGFIIGFLRINRIRSEGVNWYLAAYKKEVLPEILKVFDENVSYKRRGMSSQEFFRIGVFTPSAHYDFSSEDEIQLTSEDVEVTFTEVKYIRRHRPSASREHKGSKDPVFQGLLMEARFNKNLSGQTYMVPDFKDTATTAGRIEGFLKVAVGAGLSQLNDFSHAYEKVDLEDGEFEHLFNIYSSDQVEARYIFTPSFIEQVKAFKILADSVVYMALFNNTVFVLVDWDKDLFEPPSGEIDPTNLVEAITPTISELSLLLNMVKSLRLEQNIWLKT